MNTLGNWDCRPHIVMRFRPNMSLIFDTAIGAYTDAYWIVQWDAQLFRTPRGGIQGTKMIETTEAGCSFVWHSFEFPLAEIEGSIKKNDLPMSQHLTARPFSSALNSTEFPSFGMGRHLFVSHCYDVLVSDRCGLHIRFHLSQYE